MIRTQISLILGTGVLGLALMSSSSGVAEQIQNLNRTGEPGTSNTCNQCHGGGTAPRRRSACWIPTRDRR